jgi:hypothetical protein
MPKSRTERVLLGVMAVLVVAFVFVIKDLFVQRVVEAGDKAPNFRVTTENGKTITRDDFGGKLLVLNFWATWCPPCVEETPSLSEFARQAEWSCSPSASTRASRPIGGSSSRCGPDSSQHVIPRRKFRRASVVSNGLRRT